MSEQPKDNYTLLMGLDTMDLVIDENTQTVKWVDKPVPEPLRRGHAVPTGVSSWSPELVGDEQMVGWSRRGYRRRPTEEEGAQCMNKPMVPLPEFTCLCLLCQQGKQHPYDTPGCTCKQEPIPKVIALKKQSWLQKLLDYLFW